MLHDLLDTYEHLVHRVISGYQELDKARDAHDSLYWTLLRRGVHVEAHEDGVTLLIPALEIDELFNTPLAAYRKAVELLEGDE